MLFDRRIKHVRQQTLTIGALCLLCICPSLASGETPSPPKPTRYRAEAWLMIQPMRPFIAFPEAGSPEQTSLDRHIRTQLALIESPVVLGRAIEDGAISDLPVLRDAPIASDRLGELVTVRSVDDTDLVVIAAEDTEPHVAENLANAVVRAYLDVQRETYDLQSQQIVDLLDKELDRRHRELERLRGSVRILHKLAKVIPGGQVDSESGLWESQDAVAIRIYQAKVAETNVRRIELAARIEMLRKRTPKTDPPAEMAAKLNELMMEADVYHQMADELEQAIARRRANIEKESPHQLDLEFARAELERADHVYKLIADRAEAMRTEMRAPAQVSLLRPASAVPISSE